MARTAGVGRHPRRPVRHAGRPAMESLEGRVFLHAAHVNDAVVPLAAPEDGVHLRVNAGGKALVDGTGHRWERDRYARGGTSKKKWYDVAGTLDDRIFADVRTGKFIRYSVPVPAGSYTLNLLFADPQFTGAGQRTFNVTVEGQPVLANFDVAASGGGRSAISRAFPVTITDGKLHLNFH